MAEKLLLIDAHGYLHRAYHALPPLTTSKGEPVNAILGFTRMLLKLFDQQKPDYCGVCFDAPGPTFRETLFRDYKATRKETEAELKSQFPLSREIVRALGLAQFELEGFEADDLIATLAAQGAKKGWSVLIVSGDKDILQIVDSRIHVLNEPKQVLFDPEKVKERWGVRPDQIADVLALMGDSTDNIPGVPGVGEKTAVKLVQAHESLEALLRGPNGLPEKLRQKLIEGRDQILKSRELLALRPDVPVEIRWDDCRFRSFEKGKLLPILQRLEFHALVRDLYAKGHFKAESALSRPPGNYQTVLSGPDLDALAARLNAPSGFAFDVETTGLDARHSELVGISFSWKEGEAAYVPLRHRVLGAPALPDPDQTLEVLKPYFENPQIPKTGHNLKFDISVLAQAGIRVRNLGFDTMLAAYCLDPSRPTYRLKDLAQEILGREMARIENLLTVPRGKRSEAALPMDQVPLDKITDYACADADVSGILKIKLEPQLREKGCERLFAEIEMPLIEILADMERAGIRLDRPTLQKLDGEFAREIENLERRAHELAGQDFNLQSGRQLAFILFEKLKLPPQRRTKTGFSTDEDVLKTLAPLHELPEVLLRHREATKLKSTYIDSFLERMDPETDRIHSSFNQTGTATGRLSSNDPNLQNIPIRTELGRKIRRAFVPEKGRVFLSADYSQIDLRVLAHLSQDPALVRAFHEGADIHRSTAAEVFHVPLEAVTEEQRKRAKAINFGIVYGQQAFGLSQALGISMSEAQDLITRYFQRYSGVKDWIENTKREAHGKGWVRTLLGRTRSLPEINSSNGSIRSFAERIAVNTPVQGTSADIIKAAMIRLQKGLGARPAAETPRLLVQVHDDLLFELPPSRLKESALWIRREMEAAMELAVPLRVDLKSGPNWADLEPLSL